MSTFLLLSLMALVFWYFWRESQKPEGFPPGPPRYPFVGSLPSFLFGKKDKTGKRTKTATLLRFLEKYGDMVGFYIGKTPAVVISDFDMLKSLFKMEETIGRTASYPSNELRPGWQATNSSDNEGHPPGVLFTHGEFWREQRRFILRNLRDLGIGKSSMEDDIVEEVNKLMDEMLKTCGQPTTLVKVINIAILNALWAILTGEKLGINDPKALKTVTVLAELIEHGPGPRPPISHLLPSYSMLKWKILYPLTRRDLQLEVFGRVAKMIQQCVQAHKESFDSENIKDFVDLMIKEIEGTGNPKSSFYKDRGYSFLINDLIDLFVAGMETTSTSLLWVFLFMLHHPDVKRKVHDELDRVSSLIIL